MKTLKKSLALVLAVVMVVGVLAISASAEAYNDDAQIQYKEAVEVLSAIGVIDGKDGNNFDPTGTLTREEGAAIVTRAIITKATANLLTAGSASFSDVATTRWSAGYIDYSVTQGILDGIGGNKFDPTGTLTGTAFAKMLLAGIGVTGEYTGAGWATNVILAAQKAGLASGISNFDYSAAITRDQAAQMAYNAINYSAKGKTSGYIVTDENGKTLYEGTDAITALLMAQQKDTNELGTTTISEGSIANSVYGLVKTTKTADAFGRPTTTVTGNNKVKVEVTTEATATYAGTKVKKSDIATLLGAEKVADEYTITVITDGVSAKPETITKATTGTFGATGALTEVYKTGDNTATIVVINTYAAKLAKTDIFAAKKATATADATAAYIKIGTMTFDTDAFKADDVVIYSVANGKIQSVAKANSVSGAITATATGYVRVDGEKYVESDTSTAPAALLKVGSTVNTYYLDNYNNIIFAVEGKAADVETSYIYVLNVAAKAATSKAGDLFAESTSSAAAAQAQVIDIATGTISVVDQAVVKNTSDGKYYYANKTGAASTTEVVDVLASASFTPAIYEYTTLEDGSIVLVGTATTESVTLDAKQASIGVDGAYANSSTTVTVVETSTDKNGNVTSAKVTNYTGIANFPKLSASAVVTKNTSGLVSSIVIVKGEETTTAVNYAVYAGEGETDSTGTKHAFYVNGEKVEYYSKVTGLAKDSVYDITVSGTEVTAAKAITGTKATISAIDSTFVVADGKVVYLASEVAVYNSADNYAKAEISVDDVVTYYTNSDNQIDLIIIAAAE